MFLLILEHSGLVSNEFDRLHFLDQSLSYLESLELFHLELHTSQDDYQYFKPDLLLINDYEF